MPKLAGRVAIVTGAGRGIGRAYALALAEEGAAVVVNDIGVDPLGNGIDTSPAKDVVAEIAAKGGRAVANFDDVSDWNATRNIVKTAISAFGGLHILVNNAGILLHETIRSTTERDWDRAIDINLKGTLAMTKWAMEHWAAQKEAGQPVKASVINTTSIGSLASLGTSENSCPSYSASKVGVINLGFVTAIEGAPLGVRANVIAPGGRTRLTLAFRGEEAVTQRINGFDFADPANIAPLVVYLAMENCPVTGAVLLANGNQVALFKQWPCVGTREAKGRWSVEMLEEAVPELLEGKLAMGSRSHTLDDVLAMNQKAKAAL